MNILLADNQDITKAGIRYLLSRISQELIVTEIKNKKGLISQLQQDERCAVILDFTSMDIESVDELLVIQSRFTKTEWLLFSYELSEEFIRRAILSSNKFSIVMKDGEAEEISFALHNVLRCERYICRYASDLLLREQKHDEPKEKDLLTPTEKEILKEIALGKTTKEIAAERCLSFHTVNTHTKNIFRKLEVNNVHEATKYAMRAGIIDAAEYCI